MNPKYLKSSYNYSAVADGVMATKDMLSSAYGEIMHITLMADAVEPLGSKAWFVSNGIRLVNHIHAFYTSFIADIEDQKLDCWRG